MNNLELVKTIKSKGYISLDWGDSRIFRKPPYHTNLVFTFTYRDKPNSNINDVIHLTIK